jgi:hypothetical protein
MLDAAAQRHDFRYNLAQTSGIKGALYNLGVRPADLRLASIVAFRSDIGTYQDDVTVMTMTEFVRTVKQNGNGGKGPIQPDLVII